MSKNKWVCENCGYPCSAERLPEHCCIKCGEYSWATYNDKPKDNVNHPSHYTAGQIEVIDYIKDNLTTDKYVGYCVGNVLKYVSRYEHKNGVEDLEKAAVYLQYAIEVLKEDKSNG